MHKQAKVELHHQSAHTYLERIYLYEEQFKSHLQNYTNQEKIEDVHIRELSNIYRA